MHTLFLMGLLVFSSADTTYANLTCVVPPNQNIEACVFSGTVGAVPLVISNGFTGRVAFAGAPGDSALVTVYARSLRRGVLSQDSISTQFYLSIPVIIATGQEKFVLALQSPEGGTLTDVLFTNYTDAEMVWSPNVTVMGPPDSMGRRLPVRLNLRGPVDTIGYIHRSTVDTMTPLRNAGLLIQRLATGDTLANGGINYHAVWFMPSSWKPY